jgi:hypothetical protein
MWFEQLMKALVYLVKTIMDAEPSFIKMATLIYDTEQHSKKP